MQKLMELPQVRQAKNVSIYLSMGGEINTSSIVKELYRQCSFLILVLNHLISSETRVYSAMQKRTHADGAYSLAGAARDFTQEQMGNS